MNWAHAFYGWGGFNEALFHQINGATPQAPSALIQFFALAGGYWSAPVVMAGLWLHARRTDDKRQAMSINSVLISLAVAYGVALIAASLLKVTFAFPRPALVFGDAIRVIGEADSQYSLPSGHATFSALVISALWTLVNNRLRWILVMYLAAVGWSRVAAGMHFPTDVVAGWVVGATSVQVAKKLHFWKSFKTQTVGLWCALTIAMLDQLAKSLVSDHMTVLEIRAITPFFNLVHVLNPGAAFSFLANAGGWQRYFFLSIAVLACGWLVVILSRPRSRIESTGFSFILGGAMSNALDRALRGPVVDYLDIYWNAWHWPAFNIADVAICIGAGLVLVLTFKQSQESSRNNPGGIHANH